MKKAKRTRNARPYMPVVFLVAGLLATPLLSLAMPVYAADITINGLTSGDVYGNSSKSDGSVYDLPANGNTVTITTGAAVTGDVVGGAVNMGNGAATASGNRVNMTGGTVNGNGVTGGGATTNAGTAIASDNTVTISGGTVDTVWGGVSGSQDGAATTNHNAVTISGGTVSNAFGGESVALGTGAATANTNGVYITSGATINAVIGGTAYSEKGPATATGNVILIDGGTITGGVIGGIAISDSGTATATGNVIVIDGGNISGNVFAAVTMGPELANITSKDNLIAIEGTAPLDMSGANLIGLQSVAKDITGAAILAEDLPHDRFSGIFLLSRPNVTVAGLYGFINLNFLLPANFGNGDTMLTVTDARIGYSQVNIAVNGTSSPLQVGDKVNLISATNSLDGVPDNTKSAIQGLTRVYDFSVSKEGNNLTAEVKSISAARSPGGNSIPELIQAIDFAATTGIRKAVEATAVKQSGSGLRPFGAVGGASMHYDTGSSVDVNSLSLIAGLSQAKEYEDVGRLTFGGFLEYGHGSYDTYASYTNLTARGSGSVNNIGLGVLGRLDLRQFGEGISAGRFYLDASARLGYVKSNFVSDSLRELWGATAGFDTQSLYYGAHLGGGYLLAVSDNSQADFYLRLLWTHQNGDDVQSSIGEEISFDALDSLRTVVGGRYNWVAKSWLVPYAGLAWEHEFAGEGNASSNGDKLRSSNLSGDTGMAEIGAYVGANASKWVFDLGVQGYVGAREGVSGTLRVVYRW